MARRWSSTGALVPGESVEAARRLLGVDRGTSSGDLRRVFEGVALAQHPDKKGGTKELFDFARLVLPDLLQGDAAEASAAGQCLEGDGSEANSPPVMPSHM